MGQQDQQIPKVNLKKYNYQTVLPKNSNTTEFGKISKSNPKSNEKPSKKSSFFNQAQNEDFKDEENKNDILENQINKTHEEKNRNIISLWNSKSE